MSGALGRGTIRPMLPASPPAPPRSYLFAPGDRPERFDKAWDSRADAVILDLEDAVSPERKPQAREHVARWLDRRRPVWLRVNPVDSPWFADDLRLAGEPGVAGIVLPKAEGLPPELLALCRRGAIGGVIALIETAEGLQRAREIGGCAGVVRLAFGSLDFQVDLGIEGDGRELLFFRSQLVWQSRLAGLPAPIDGVATALDDAAAIQAEALASRRLGFGARLCIHPRQLEPVHQAFAPDAVERAWAERVLAAMEASGGSAVAVDGRMVDRPVWLRAQRIAIAPDAQQLPARLVQAS